MYDTAQVSWNLLLSQTSTLPSRLAALNKPRVENNIPDVVSTKDPGKKPLQSKTVTSMGTGAILSLEKERKGGGGREKEIKQKFNK